MPTTACFAEMPTTACSAEMSTTACSAEMSTTACSAEMSTTANLCVKDKGSARCNWAFHAHVTRARTRSGGANRRQKNHTQEEALLCTGDKRSFQRNKKARLARSAVGNNESAGERDITIKRRRDYRNRFITASAFPKDKDGTKGDNSDPAFAQTSDILSSDTTRQGANISADTSDETLSTNTRTGRHSSKSCHENFNYSDPYLPLRFSEEFLVTHSTLTDFPICEDRIVKRKSVIKVSLPDFSDLSEKICGKCRPRMLDPGQRTSQYMFCHELSNHTKVVLRRINISHQNMHHSGQDIASSVNELNGKMDNTTELSPDLNGNVKGLHENRNVTTNNQSENTDVSFFMDTQYKNVSNEPALTKENFNASIKTKKDEKRTLPPLKIPEKVYFFPNFDSDDDATQDDETPEYPLKGDIFFKPRTTEQEPSSNNQIPLAPVEQNRNFFSDFSTQFSNPEIQGPTWAKNENVNGDINYGKLQRCPEAHRTSNLEPAQSSVEALITRRYESEASSSVREQFNPATADCGLGPGLSWSNPTSVAGKMQVCDSSSDSKASLIHNSSEGKTISKRGTSNNGDTQISNAERSIDSSIDNQVKGNREDKQAEIKNRNYSRENNGTSEHLESTETTYSRNNSNVNKKLTIKNSVQSPYSTFITVQNYRNYKLSSWPPQSQPPALIHDCVDNAKDSRDISAHYNTTSHLQAKDYHDEGKYKSFINRLLQEDTTNCQAFAVNNSTKESEFALDMSCSKETKTKNEENSTCKKILRQSRKKNDVQDKVDNSRTLSPQTYGGSQKAHTTTTTANPLLLEAELREDSNNRSSGSSVKGNSVATSSVKGNSVATNNKSSSVKGNSVATNNKSSSVKGNSVATSSINTNFVETSNKSSSVDVNFVATSSVNTNFVETNNKSSSVDVNFVATSSVNTNFVETSNNGLSNSLGSKYFNNCDRVCDVGDRGSNSVIVAQSKSGSSADNPVFCRVEDEALAGDAVSHEKSLTSLTLEPLKLKFSSHSKETGKIVESQYKLSAATKVSPTADVQYLRTSPAAVNYSFGKNLDKSQFDLHKNSTINLDAIKSPFTNVCVLNIQQQEQLISAAKKYVSNSQSRDLINNTAASMPTVRRRRLSSEKASPDSTEKSNSLFYPDLQTKPLKVVPSSLYVVHDKEVLCPLQERCMPRTMLHNVASQPFGKLEFNYTNNEHTCQTSETYGQASTDNELEYATTSVQCRQNHSEQIVSTVKKNPTCEIEIAAKTVKNSVRSTKYKRGNSTREQKQVPANRSNVIDVASLVYSPKQWRYNGAGTEHENNDNYNAVLAASSGETQLRHTGKKLKITDSLEKGDIIYPVSNVSSTDMTFNAVDIESHRNNQNHTSSQQNPFVRSVRVSSTVEHKSEEQPSIQKDAPQPVRAKRRELSSTLVSTAAIGTIMDQQPAASLHAISASNLERSSRHSSHFASGLSHEPDYSGAQSTKKETSNQFNANQIQNRHSQLTLVSSSLTQQSNHHTLADRNDYNSSQLIFRSKNLPTENTAHVPSYMHNSYVNNVDTVSLQAEGGGTTYHTRSERNHMHIQGVGNMFIPPQQLPGSSHVGSTSSSKPEAIGRQINRVNQPFQSIAAEENSFSSNTSIENCQYNPLWESMQMRYHSTEANARNGVPSLHISKPVEKKAAKRKHAKRYSDPTPLSLQEHVACVNQHLPCDAFQQPGENVFYENMNALRRTQSTQLSQRGTTEYQSVDVNNRIRYPSWVKIPHEEPSYRTSTVESPSLNSHFASVSPIMSKICKHKLRDPHITPAHSSFLKDSAFSVSNESSSKRLPRERAKSEQVDTSRYSSSLCEPLDLSPWTGRNTFYSNSANPDPNDQHKSNMPESNNNQTCSFNIIQAPGNQRPDSVEMFEHNPQCTSSNRGSSQALTNVLNGDIATQRSQATTLLTTNSQSTALSSTNSLASPDTPTPSQQTSPYSTNSLVSPDTPTPSQQTAPSSTSSLASRDTLAPLHPLSNLPEDESMQALNQVNPQSPVSQVVSTSEGNDITLPGQVATVVEQQAHNEPESNIVSTSVQANVCHVWNHSPLKASLPNVITSPSKQSNSTQSVVAQSILSTSDLLIKEVKTPSSQSACSVSSVISSHVGCTSASLAASRPIVPAAKSDSSSMPSTPRPHFHNIKENSGSSNCKVVPLPIQDFFTNTPKENGYSSLLMAEITSQNKRRLGLHEDIIRSPPLFRSKAGSYGTSFEVDNSLQRKFVIDLTGDIDDCDVVSISSKDSLDDDSRIDFLDISMRDRVPTPGSVTASSSISETAGIEGRGNARTAGLQGELTVSSTEADVSVVTTDKPIEYHVSDISGSDYPAQSYITPTDITGDESVPPRYIIDTCLVNDMHTNTGNFAAFEETEFTFDIISDIEDTAETYTTVEHQQPPSSAHLIISRPMCNINDSEHFDISKKRSTPEISSPSSDILKIVPEFKNIMAAKLRNAVASRTSCETSEAVMVPMETNYNKKWSPETKQQYVTNTSTGVRMSTHYNSTPRTAACMTSTHDSSTPRTAAGMTSTHDNSTPRTAAGMTSTCDYNTPRAAGGITLLTRDNSTQRAAATLLELSTNPLYNPYTIRPETSDAYHEKVYHVHPTLDDNKTAEQERQSSSPGALKDSEKSRTRTGRRVGRPPKYQFNSSDTTNSEKITPVPSNTTTPYMNSSNSEETTTVPSNYMTPYLNSSNSDGSTSNYMTPYMNSSNSDGSTTVTSTYVTPPVNYSNSVSSTRNNKSQTWDKIPFPTDNMFYTAEIWPSAFHELPPKPPVTKRRRRCKGVANLTNTFSVSLYPATTAANSSAHNVSSGCSCGSCADIRPSFVSHVYDYFSNKSQNSGSDNIELVRSNTTDKLLQPQTYDHSSLEGKRGLESPDRGNRKRVKRMSKHDDMEIIEGRYNETTLGTSPFMSNMKSTTRSPSTEPPGLQGFLNIVVDNEAHSDNTHSSVTKCGNKIAENKCKNKSKRARKSQQRKKNQGNQQKSSISEFDDVLHKLDSNETGSNIVIKTSFEDDLRVVSLHAEGESHFGRQSLQNDDQIVPANQTKRVTANQAKRMPANQTKRETANQTKRMPANQTKPDAETSQSKISEQNGHAAVMTSRLSFQKLSKFANSELLGFRDSTTTAVGNKVADNEVAREIEKEKAVTSMLAEMMHSKTNKHVPC